MNSAATLRDPVPDSDCSVATLFSCTAQQDEAPQFVYPTILKWWKCTLHLFILHWMFTQHHPQKPW